MTSLHTILVMWMMSTTIGRCRTKIIERHVHDHLLEYLDVHGLIYKNLPGFRKQYSTEMALAYIAESLLFNLDRNRVNGIVLLD